MAATAVQYARGVVVLDGAAAFRATSGGNLWRKTMSPEKPPLIRGDWVIDWPMACNLLTGGAYETEDVLGRGPRAARFPRAYACGDLSGCEQMLFFRYGMSGSCPVPAGLVGGQLAPCVMSERSAASRSRIVPGSTPPG